MPPLDRRTFLRGVGAALALPTLDCMLPSRVAAATSSGSVLPSLAPKRLLAVHVALGMHGPAFFPQQTGSMVELPHLLQPMAKIRDKFTVFSGLEHADVVGGHRGIVGFLTGVNVFGFPGFDYKNTISLDQVYARHVGSETRFDSLQLATSGNSSSSSWDVSWSAEGVAKSATSRPREVFNRLFGNESEGNPTARRQAYQRRVSLLDRVLDQAKALDRKLGSADRTKMDEYLTSVRAVEQRIEKAEAWASIPKPTVDREAPRFNSNEDIDMFENAEIMYDLIALAFETDSTRSITLQVPSTGIVFNNIDGISEGYHAVSHHGMEAGKIQQLLKIERRHTAQLARFLERLGQTQENGQPLLDSTSVLFGSGLGNASSHSNRKLPVILAGGGYATHGQHMHLGEQPPPLSNLFVSMLQNLGVATDQFADSTGTLTTLA